MRLGRVGADEIADDDDVVIVIAPQNMIGAEVIFLVSDLLMLKRFLMRSSLKTTSKAD